MSKPIIELRDYSYRYSSEEDLVLKHVTFTINEGDFVGIVGCNRAGKSTLCKSIVGIVPVVVGGDWDGEILVDGKSMNETRGKGVMDVVGIVFQDAESQFTQQTVEDEIAFAMCNFGYDRALMRERIQFAAEACGLAGMLDRSPYRLSGGQQQRLAVACILELQPRVIILDESTSQLDPIGRDEIFRLVGQLHKAGKTIIMVDHNIEKIAEAVDKVLVLHEGELVAYDDPHKVFADKENMNSHFVRLPQVTDAALALRGRLGGTPDLPRRCVKMAEAVIRVEKLVHVYPRGNVKALKGIDLDINKGDVVSIVGQNGSGKTTLVRHFNGLLRPTEGKVYLMGEDSTGKSVAEMSRRCGYVFQNPNHQIFCTTVREELMVAPKYFGFTQQQADESLKMVSELMGLEHLLDKHPMTLDYTTKKIITIASVLIFAPEVLVLDEPTGGLDEVGREMLTKIIRLMHDEGHTVVIISHDMDYVAENSSRVVVMAQGEILDDAVPEKVFLNADILKHAQVEPPQIMQLDLRLGRKGMDMAALSVADFVKKYDS